MFATKGKQNIKTMKTLEHHRGAVELFTLVPFVLLVVM